MKFGRRGLPVTLCSVHLYELERLVRSKRYRSAGVGARLPIGQGKDWGTTRREGFNARFYYASKRGFHSY